MYSLNETNHIEPHKLETYVDGNAEVKQEEEEKELWRSEQGSGSTSREKPSTLEQNHEGDDDSELIEKVRFERHIDANGESTNPEKLPATVTFDPTTSLKVMPPTSGSALGS